MKTMLLLSLPVCFAGALQAQSFGITLGAADAAPQEIEKITVKRSSGFVAGLSYRSGRFEFGVSHRVQSTGEVRDDGEATGEKYSWGYTAANALAVIPFAHSGETSHSVVLGGSFRSERAEFKGDEVVRDSRGRLWAVAGYQLSATSDKLQTEITIGAAATKRDSYDSGKVYSNKDAVRAFAPSVEFFASLTVRF